MQKHFLDSKIYLKKTKILINLNKNKEAKKKYENSFFLI